jgi:hypothetical protein
MKNDFEMKQTILEAMSKDEFLQKTFDRVPDLVEREKIKNFVENFCLKFAEGLELMKKTALENPEEAAKILADYIPKV